jgi:hypothetical protein
MRARPLRALGWTLGAIGFYLAFRAGGEWSDAYLMHYGSFLPSRGELAFRLHLLLFILPATVLVAAAVAEVPAVADRLLRAFEALRGARRVWLAAIPLALLALALVMVVRTGVLREAPVTDDENVYLFQARLLAAGRLYAESLPASVRPFFDNQFIINNGRWFGMYFVGHPAVLALGLLAGVVQWVGAIEAALILLLAVAVARRVLGDGAGLLTAGLLVLSPFFLFLSATHLSQPTSALLLTLFIYATLRVEASPQAVGWWGVAAVALACGVITRPQSAVLLSLPFLVRLGLLAVRGRLRPGWAPPLVAAIIFAAGAGVFLAINHALTGDILRTSYHAYWERVEPFNARTTALYPVREISQNLTQLNFWLFGWPLSLAFVPFFRRTGLTWTLAAVPVVSAVAQGLTGVPTVAAVGPVYYGETIVPLVILSASGIERAITALRERLGDVWPTRALAAWPLAAILGSLLAFIPVELASLSLMADVARAPYDLVEEQRLDSALVFVHSLPALHRAPGAWVYYHRNNSPDLSDRVLFVRYLGEERNRELMRYLPDRTPYAMGMQDGTLELIRLQP